MLTLKKYMAVVAILAAAALTSASRPASAVVVFDFQGICDLCSAALGGNGVDVQATLQLDLTPPLGGTFNADDIISFAMLFDPGGVAATVTFNAADDDPGFFADVALSDSTGPVGTFNGDGSAILTADFFDVAGQEFNYSIGEGFDSFFFQEDGASNVVDAFGDASPPGSLSFNRQLITTPEPSGLITLLGSIVLLTLVRRRAAAAPLRG